MKLVKLTQKEEEELYWKVGDLSKFKSKILHSTINLLDFDIFKDVDSRDKATYIALKSNSQSQVKPTGISLSR
jgi:hypothetical protein